MKKSPFRYLFSTRLTGFLFLLFPIAMAAGTFVESIYDTVTARIWIYNSWWFELIIFLLFINFLGNIKKYRLFRKERWATLGLHLSFILIILGAFITRYFGYEGVMPIREGATENTFLSDKTYLSVWVDGEIEGQPLRRKLQKPLLLSEHARNNFRLKYTFGSQPFTIKYKNFLTNVTKGLILDENEERYLKIVAASKGLRDEHYLKEGEIININNVLFSLNNFTKGAVNIDVKEGVYTIESPFAGRYLRMADQKSDTVWSDKKQPLAFRSLYTLSNFQFVIPDPLLRGKIGVVKEGSNDQSQDALTLSITTGGDTKSITVWGGKGIVNDFKKIKVADLDFYVQYGSLALSLPFSIRLNDFIAEKYPGTEKSYASFMSKITVSSEKEFDHNIFMNHILDYKGYRFYQASFDADEKGTILSVNHDFLGTLITYIGYFFLYASLIGIFFIGKTRFKAVSKMLRKIQKEKEKLLTILVLFVSFFSLAQFKLPTSSDLDSILEAQSVSKEHASRFGAIIIQDFGGRMKPVNTFSSELLRKVSKKDTYKEWNADQLFLSILSSPSIGYFLPIIYLKRNNDSIRKIIGVSKKTKRASLLSFFDEKGNYKLSSHLEEAYRSRFPNQFQKDFIETDKRVNLLYSAIEGKIVQIFPVPGDKNNTWLSYAELEKGNFQAKDSLYVYNILPIYFNRLRKAKMDGDYTKANEILESINNFQKKYGHQILPKRNKIKAEILYNKYDIFKKLFSWYLYAGTLLFVIVIFQIFNTRKTFRTIIFFLKGIIIILFALHTLGMITRSFISGHAPWSDAYESMLYVSWGTLFFGIIFGKKSALTLAATSFVSSMILMIAHWNWLDPAIANLQPVLDSYWLMIHVAVIVGSYGPFALGMIIGSIVLLLMIFVNKKNKEKIALSIKELTYINELSLTIGLVMLTIGNFLGGMWANESWGRYWGWDPKETWALISIMVYAFTLHMRLIPGLQDKWSFNFVSVLSFGSILMTYFGVNFYLVGLHSYASGDKVITPSFIYYSAIILLLLGIASYIKYKKFFHKKIK